MISEAGAPVVLGALLSCCSNDRVTPKVNRCISITRSIGIVFVTYILQYQYLVRFISQAGESQDNGIKDVLLVAPASDEHVTRFVVVLICESALEVPSRSYCMVLTSFVPISVKVEENILARAKK